MMTVCCCFITDREQHLKKKKSFAFQSVTLLFHQILKDHTGVFLTFHHQQKPAVRLHFQSPFTASHVETGYRNAIGHVKIA